MVSIVRAQRAASPVRSYESEHPASTDARRRLELTPSEPPPETLAYSSRPIIHVPSVGVNAPTRGDIKTAAAGQVARTRNSNPVMYAAYVPNA